MTHAQPKQPQHLHRALSLSIAALLTLTVGCVDGPPYYYAEKITGARFTPHHERVGVYPNQSVLTDPENPFRFTGVSAEVTWEIEASGDAVAGFYAWATRLSAIPTGENQFYAALNMRAIYERALVSADELELAKALAVQGFQAVLDHFPKSVTYDITGEVPYGLATLAYQQLIELEERPQGGWVLVAQEGGGVVAIQNLDVPSGGEE